MLHRIQQTSGCSAHVRDYAISYTELCFEFHASSLLKMLLLMLSRWNITLNIKSCTWLSMNMRIHLPSGGSIDRDAKLGSHWQNIRVSGDVGHVQHWPTLLRLYRWPTLVWNVKSWSRKHGEVVMTCYAVDSMGNTWLDAPLVPAHNCTSHT